MQLLPLALRSSDLIRAGVDDRHLRRRASSGSLVRIARGAYLPSDRWSPLLPRDRYITTVHAVVSRLSGPVTISHWSAAAIWGMPVPDAWPTRVHVIDRRRTASHTTATVHSRPATGEPIGEHVWEGLAITGAARTAADIALSAPFDHAVLVLDDGLRRRLFTRAEVEVELGCRPRAHRRRSAAAALRFASEKAEYPGESFSRVAMAVRGFVEPALQEPFHDRGGLIGFVDFWWESVGVVGEFDGQWKYTGDRWLKGRIPAQAFADEKRRQARLAMLPQVKQIVRWDYAVARDSDALATRLLAAGVPRLDGSGRARHLP